MKATDHDPIPADLLFFEPANMPYASYARRERAEVVRELNVFADDNDAYEYEIARVARGLLSCKGM